MALFESSSLVGFKLSDFTNYLACFACFSGSNNPNSEIREKHGQGLSGCLHLPVLPHVSYFWGRRQYGPLFFKKILVVLRIAVKST